MKQILLRLIGFICFIIGICIFGLPYLFATIILSIDKANVMMSYLLRIPTNLFFEDNFGNDLLNTHKEILNKKHKKL